MRFTNFRLLGVVGDTTLVKDQATGELVHTPIPTPNPNYFDGLQDMDLTPVGKVCHWDDSNPEYVIYDDGDLILADRVLTQREREILTEPAAVARERTLREHSKAVRENRSFGPVKDGIS